MRCLDDNQVCLFRAIKGGFQRIKRYGLRVSPWMVLWLIWIGGVAVKWAPLNEMEDSAYMLPISSMAFGGCLLPLRMATLDGQ